MIWKVRFFQTARRTYPVREFIEKLDEATIAKTLHVITLLEQNGPFLSMPFVKKLRNTVYELRISGKVAVRILFCRAENEFYLLHAFKKKSQKIPMNELATAIDRMNEII